MFDLETGIAILVALICNDRQRLKHGASCNARCAAISCGVEDLADAVFQFIICHEKNAMSRS